MRQFLEDRGFKVLLGETAREAMRRYGQEKEGDRAMNDQIRSLMKHATEALAKRIESAAMSLLDAGVPIDDIVVQHYEPDVEGYKISFHVDVRPKAGRWYKGRRPLWVKAWVWKSGWRYCAHVSPGEFVTQHDYWTLECGQERPAPPVVSAGKDCGCGCGGLAPGMFRHCACGRFIDMGSVKMCEAPPVFPQDTVAVLPLPYNLKVGRIYRIHHKGEWVFADLDGMRVETVYIGKDVNATVVDSVWTPVVGNRIIRNPSGYDGSVYQWVPQHDSDGTPLSVPVGTVSLLKYDHRPDVQVVTWDGECWRDKHDTGVLGGGYKVLV